MLFRSVSGMMMPPFVFSSPSMRRMTTRSCNGRNFMGFAPGLTCDAGLGRDALALGSGLKPDVDSCRWHSLQESAKALPTHST